jgi:hypothetical protein
LVGFKAAVAADGKIVGSSFTHSSPLGSLRHRTGVPVKPLVRRRIGIAGKPAFPPGTTARAVPTAPSAPSHRGASTVVRTSPGAACAARGEPIR